MSAKGIAVGLLWAALAAPLGAQDTGTDVEQALHEGLAQAALLIEQGDLAGGRRSVLDLVAAHEHSDAVLLQLHRVKELLKRCAFRGAVEQPDATDLIAGDLQSYDRRSGKIRVHYVRKPGGDDDGDDDSREARVLGQLLGITSGVGTGDFSYSFGAPMHPIVFAGPYTVEIEGTMPDKDDTSLNAWLTNPQMVINCGDEGVYRVNFGYPRSAAGWYGIASIRHTVAGKTELLDEDKKGTPLELGKKYTVKIVVNKGNITASGNGRTFLKCKKAGDNYGQFGFRGCSDVSGLSINGIANTAWVEGLEDQWRQKAWDEFDETYSPMDELPPSLVTRFGEAVERKESVLAEHPGPVMGSHLRHHGTLARFLDDHDYEKLLHYVEGLSPAEVGESWQRWLMAVAQANLGQTRDALTLIELVLEQQPDFVPAQIMRSNLLFGLGDEDKALTALRDAIAGGSTDVRAHVALARALVTRGHFDEARDCMAASIAAGIAPAELESTAFMLTRARNGPEWPSAFESRTRRYLVRTDLSDKLAAEASKQLEASLSMYNRLFGRSDNDADELYPVYLFSGLSGYLGYAGDLFGSKPTNTAGLYSPVLKQLLIWNLPDHDAMLATVRHEGFHQYLDSLVHEPPTWFNEGMAEYVETASLKRGTMTAGAPVMPSVYRLTDADTEWTPLADLVRMPRSGFYSKGTLHYAEAWALLHYLQHTGRDEKRLFDAYMAAVLDGADAEQAADQVFERVDMAALQKKVRAHLKELRGDD